MTRHDAKHPCKVCGEHQSIPQGLSKRCWGFLSEDGQWEHCSREEFAGAIPLHAASQTYAHKLIGDCACGVSHGGEIIDLSRARGSEIVATYDYTDADGNLLYQVVRKHPKAFLQRRPQGSGWSYDLSGVDRVLYRLPAVRKAATAEDLIYVTEGEKDADALWSLGYVATTNAGGSSNWLPHYGQDLAGADVVVVCDRDEPGIAWARKVYASTKDLAKSVRVVEARAGKDTSDHLAAGYTVDQFLPVWPRKDLLKSDPVEWKRVVVLRSQVIGDPCRQIDRGEVMARAKEPTWPTGLEGGSGILPNFRGVTILTGAPSSGKSYLAIASSVQAALFGWDVLYLASEMGDRPLMERFTVYCDGDLPSTLSVISVTFGASIEALVNLVAGKVTERPLLVVMDSISSFIDQAAGQNPQDVHGIGPLKQWTMWAINVRRTTEGQIAFLVLSETNREGHTKGRFGDHKADLVVSMASDDKQKQIKHVCIVKGWEYQGGAVGDFSVNARTARLVRIPG